MKANPSKPKCVVTGAAGFIASHLCDRLVADGHEVVGIDDFATGRADNLAQVAGSPAFTLHRADVADFERIAPLFDGADWVFHLAARADIVPAIREPRSYHRVNVDGTFAVLEASRRADVKRFVYAASSTCYGIPDIYPTPETAAIRPMHPYALTKHVGEEYVMHWHRTYGLAAVSLRLFNVFGPRHRTTGAYGAVFGVFLAQKLAAKPLTVVGDGTQTRDFTFVTDVVEAMVAAAGADVAGEVMNVGSGDTYSVNHLVALLSSKAIHVPKRPGEPDRTFADIGKIKRLLGWRPTVSFEDGVRTLLEHIDDWRESPVWTPESIEEATADWFKYLGTATG